MLEIRAEVVSVAGDHREATRYCVAAAAIRKRMGGMVRFAIYDPKYFRLFATMRNAMGEDDVDAAWAEGSALSLEEAIAYAQRGRGERNRPSTGWGSLISRRTVQTHLTRVYAKLGITSRVALAQEAARNG